MQKHFVGSASGALSHSLKEERFEVQCSFVFDTYTSI